MHAAEPSTRPLQRLFVDFVGPFTRSKRSNIAILVVVDIFSKFVSFYPTLRITASAVMDCLKGSISPPLGRRKVWSLTMLESGGEEPMFSMGSQTFSRRPIIPRHPWLSA